MIQISVIYTIKNVQYEKVIISERNYCTKIRILILFLCCDFPRDFLYE